MGILDNAKQVAKAVADAARRVLKHAGPVDDDFSSLDTGRILADFETAKRDFNDLLIADVCRRKNLILVTDDEDFAPESVTILTANASLTN